MSKHLKRLAELNSNRTEAHKMNLSRSLKGKKKSPEQLKKLKDGQKKYWANPENRKKFSQMRSRMFQENPEYKKRQLNQVLKKQKTKIKRFIQKVLQDAGVEFEAQKVFRINHQTIIADFFLPEYGIVIECDGEYWHSLPHVKRRDHFKNQLYKSLGLQVVRLKEHSILSDPVQALLTGVEKVV